MRLIDSHCHLNYDYAPKSADQLIEEALKAEICAIMTISTEIATLPAVQALSDRHPAVFHSVGVHPHEAQQWKDGDLEILRKASFHPKCRAIGELGMDYHYDHSQPDTQKHALQMQLELALERELPVVIHSREAEAPLLEILTDYAGKIRDGRSPGVIHCFTGTQTFGQACLDLGFYISFSGILTFKNAEDLRIAAKSFPLEKILVETDSPFLAPIPYRGKKCEPAMVRQTAEKLAEIRGVAFEEIARVTTQNSARLFNLPI